MEESIIEEHDYELKNTNSENTGYTVKIKTEKCFTFTDKNTDEELTVIIPEILDPTYGMYVWPCSVVLAQYIWWHRKSIRNKTILELGAGTSLPGIVAAKCGADVVLSDSADLPQCRDNCQQSCHANGLAGVTVVGITWGRFDPGLLNLTSVDIILGSDCFYDTKDFEDILVTIAYLMDRNSNAEFWCTYQDRSSDRSLDYLLLKWNLKCEKIPLCTFDAESSCLAGSTLPGNHTIHMWIIKRKI